MDSVCDYKQLAETLVSIGRHIELRRDSLISSGDCHRTVVVGAAIEDVSSRRVYQTHQRKIGGVLKIVAIGATLR